MNQTHYVQTNLGILADWTTRCDGPFLCVVPSRRLGETLIVNLQALHGDRVGFLPDWDLQPGQPQLPGEAIQERRLEVLSRIRDGELEGLVVPIRAFGAPVLRPDSLPGMSLDVGPSEGPRAVARKLEDLGFRRRGLVDQRGDYSLRGDLLDLFPETAANPIRISFFEDEIERVDCFHPSTQMKADEAPSLPLRLSLQAEFALSPDQVDQLAQNLRNHDHDKAAELLEYDHFPDEIASWLGFWPRPTTHVDSLLPNSATTLYHPPKCWEEIQQWDNHLSDLPPDDPASFSFRRLEPLFESPGERGWTLFSTHPQETPLGSLNGTQTAGEALDVSGTDSLHPAPISRFIEHVQDLRETSQTVHVHCGQAGFKERMKELLEEKLGPLEQQAGGRIVLEEAPWRGSYRRNGIARISLDDFFDRTIRRGRIGPSRGKTEYLESFEELNPGDLVVHERFGIGRFRGLKRVSTHNQTRDTLHIEYAGDDKLFLPPDQIAWVQKYIADSGYTPSLSSLTSNRWNRIKQDVQEEIDELAEELLELYTSREESEAEPYPADTLEQNQFEANFPYRETPDQQQAIAEVKKDMRAPRPMDRLICGDSGFGKTEVALRAAFKAASSGRQVAMLVPTTVLARQHFETFSQRFSTFPYRVEMLSRFQTPEETRRTLEGLKNGSIHVVVGTHRLLSDDVDFRDLGLLVIDEEQRFGVEQKETLKFYRKNVDVLTLTATPIPRTLYMSLSGIQDISTINTPPEDRIPIQITVSPFDGDDAQSAIERELSRGGQVFWVFNRVEKIQQVAEYVRSRVPEASVAVAHGQMGKQELRETMDRFYGGKIDVLVCTTIIESGLDCPSVNTMIVQNAHKFGLAQLYQLRGRVGRSHEQAHAHLFYPSTTRLTDDAEARLETIKQCSELGSGFKLAMRDMEIRGAGSILGKNQHGNIRAVGFPFYCRLLQRSIRKLREGLQMPEPFPRLKFPGEHYIPEEYIPDSKQIIRQYQSLASCREIEEVRELAERWRDTFGPIPDPTRAVLRRHVFKIMADQNGWDDIRYKNQRLNLRFRSQPPEPLMEAARGVDAHPRVRSNRMFIRSLTPKRLKKWLKRVTEKAGEGAEAGATKTS